MEKLIESRGQYDELRYKVGEKVLCNLQKQ